MGALLLWKLANTRNQVFSPENWLLSFTSRPLPEAPFLLFLQLYTLGLACQECSVQISHCLLFSLLPHGHSMADATPLAIIPMFQEGRRREEKEKHLCLQRPSPPCRLLLVIRWPCHMSVFTARGALSLNFLLSTWHVWRESGWLGNRPDSSACCRVPTSGSHMDTWLKLFPSPPRNVELGQGFRGLQAAPLNWGERRVNRGSCSLVIVLHGQGCRGGQTTGRGREDAHTCVWTVILFLMLVCSYVSWSTQATLDLYSKLHILA